MSLVALTPRHGHREAERRARRIRSKLRKLHLPSLATALTDFQKAQCFFMLAINIAALVDRVHGGLQPQSLQQLYNTYILIKSVSTSGYLPITFNLFTLHMVDMVSWYLLVLSAITIAISTTTFFAVGNFNPSQGDLDYLSRQAAVGGLPNCGGNVPGAWCYTPLGGNAYNYNSDAGAADPSNGAHSMLAFCLVVFVLLLAHHLWFHRHLSSLDHRWRSPKLTSTRLLLTRWSLKLGEVLMKPWEMYLAIQDKFLKHRYSQRFGRWMSNKLSCLKPTRWQQTRILSWTQSEKSIRTERRRTRILRTPWILTKEARTRCSRHWEALVSDIGYSTLRKTMFFLSLYVVFFSLYVNFFVIFCTDLAWFASNGVDKSNWSFGQIVAITVWAAPFCEWVYLEMRKYLPKELR